MQVFLIYNFLLFYLKKRRNIKHPTVHETGFETRNIPRIQEGKIFLFSPCWNKFDRAEQDGFPRKIYSGQRFGKRTNAFSRKNEYLRIVRARGYKQGPCRFLLKGGLTDISIFNTLFKLGFDATDHVFDFASLPISSQRIILNCLEEKKRPDPSLPILFRLHRWFKRFGFSIHYLYRRCLLSMSAVCQGMARGLNPCHITFLHKRNRQALIHNAGCHSLEFTFGCCWGAAEKTNVFRTGQCANKPAHIQSVFHATFNFSNHKCYNQPVKVICTYISRH